MLSTTAYAFEVKETTPEFQEFGGEFAALAPQKPEAHHTYIGGGISENVNVSASTSGWRPGLVYADEGQLGVAETGFGHAGKDQVSFGGWEYKANPDAFTPPDKKPTHGVYVLGERTFYNEDDKTLVGFARAGRAAGDLEGSKNGWSAGFIMKGFLDDRPDGQLGLAVTGGGKSSQFRNGDISSGLQTRLELTYMDKVSDNVTINPGLNFTINPSHSDPAADRGLIAGMRVHVKFK